MTSALRSCGRAFLALMDLLWALFGFFVCMAWWVGWVLKDSHPTLIWLYYIPPPAMALFGFVWLFLTLRHRFRILQLFVFATVVACFIKILVVDHGWNRAPENLPLDNIRILHANTSWGALSVESVMRTLADDLPDIVMISEPPKIMETSTVAYHALGMQHVFTDAGMSLVSHYPITYLGNVVIPAGAGWHCRVDTEVGPLEIAAIDIVSRPGMNRAPTVAALTRWIASRTNKLPLVVLGDFNTPRDAASLRPLRAWLNNAYEEKGRGWPYTWPSIAPLYSIDQTWVSRDVTVQDVHYKDTRFSDHKRQVVDITYPNRQPDRPPGGAPP